MEPTVGQGRLRGSCSQGLLGGSRSWNGSVFTGALGLGWQRLPVWTQPLPASLIFSAPPGPSVN